jgi:hypothetical protein
VFSDPVTGNVVSRDGVEMIDGKAAYISTRLKVEAGGITEVEFSSDVARAKPAYVWNLPPLLTATVPEGERMTREALDALAHRYFQTLTDHKPVVADYDEARCNRFHSGNQITNVSRNMVEGEGARTCVTSNEGRKPWGPALEQRFPVIDVEHGIVNGMTLLMFPRSGDVRVRGLQGRAGQDHPHRQHRPGQAQSRAYDRLRNAQVTERSIEATPTFPAAVAHMSYVTPDEEQIYTTNVGSATVSILRGSLEHLRRKEDTTNTRNDRRVTAVSLMCCWSW